MDRMSNRIEALRKRALRHAERVARWQTEVAAIEARNGELPKRDLTELQLLKQQIDAARTEREAAKATLIVTRTTEQAKKDQLQIDLAAATTAAERQRIRAEIDACNAKLGQVRIDLDRADQTLEGLRQTRIEILLQERHTKGELLEADLPKITIRKARQARDCDEKRAWLAKHS